MPWKPRKRGGATKYHERFQDFVSHVQAYNLVVGGAMTDPKGDRSKPPHQQEDADLFVRVVERRDGGVVLRGAKVHQTGTLNSHWMVVMPGQRLSEADAEAIRAAEASSRTPGQGHDGTQCAGVPVSSVVAPPSCCGGRSEWELPPVFSAEEQLSGGGSSGLGDGC